MSMRRSSATSRTVADGATLAGSTASRTALRTRVKPRNTHHNPVIRTAYMHTVIGEHSWECRGGPCHGSPYPPTHLLRDTCRELNIRVKKPAPWPPCKQTGKIQWFRQALAAGWQFKRSSAAESVLRNALPARLHRYDHHSPTPHSEADRPSID
jgi:hypothetical protein